MELGVFLMWFMKGLTPKNELQENTSPDDQTKMLTKQMNEYLESTPWAKDVLPELLKTDKRSEEELKSEALFFAFVFSAFGLKSGMSSAIPLFLNLEEDVKVIFFCSFTKTINSFIANELTWLICSANRINKM